jgi:O-antigen/teichoic acid export membrane protein
MSSLATAVISISAIVGVIQAWIIAVAPVLIPTVFGSQWVPAIPALQLVCLGTLATIPTRFLSSTIYAMGWARTGLILSALGLGILLLAFLVLVLAFGLTGAGLAFALSAAIVLVLHARATAHSLPMNWAPIARIYGECGVAAAGSLFVITVLPSGLGLLLAGVAHVGVFALLALTFERDEIGRARRFFQPAMEAR